MLVSPPASPAYGLHRFAAAPSIKHAVESCGRILPRHAALPGAPSSSAQAICSKTLQLQGSDNVRRCVALCPALPAPLILIRSRSSSYFSGDGEIWKQPREQKDLESKTVQRLGTVNRV